MAYNHRTLAGNLIDEKMRLSPVIVGYLSWIDLPLLSMI
jgi:hypothetical protein